MSAEPMVACDFDVPVTCTLTGRTVRVPVTLHVPASARPTADGMHRALGALLARDANLRRLVAERARALLDAAATRGGDA